MTDADIPKRPPFSVVWESMRLYRETSESFRDVSRVTTSAGSGYAGVRYPADLLLASQDPASAMETAVLTALDRYVEKVDLSIPPLGSVIGRDARSLRSERGTST